LRIMKYIDPINHALFANDSLMLGGASCIISSAFKVFLQVYCRVSGALINDRKSVVHCWNVEEAKVHKVARILGFNGHSRWDKISYLGLPLTLGINRSTLWEGVLNKIKGKIEARGG